MTMMFLFTTMIKLIIKHILAFVFSSYSTKYLQTMPILLSYLTKEFLDLVYMELLTDNSFPKT